MKTAGIILILSASFATAYLTVKREMLRCKHIEEIIRYFECIKFRTVHYSDSVASIIKANQLDGDISDEFTKLCDNGTEPNVAWKHAVNSSKMILSPNEKQLVADSFNDICSSSVEALEEKCNKYINEFISIKNRHIADKDKKIKISSVTAMAFGLLIILILI